MRSQLSRRADNVAAASSSTGSDVIAAAANVKAAAAKAAWYSQRRLHGHLQHMKCAAFWRDRIETDQSDTRKLWRSVDVLLGRGRVPSSSPVGVNSFVQFFAEKVAKVRSRTSYSPPPAFCHVRSGTSFRSFSLLTTDDVINAARRLPDKYSAIDPILTSVLKQVVDLVAPLIVELFNRSPSASNFLLGSRMRSSLH